MTKKHYIGLTRDKGSIYFTSSFEPTETSHGEVYVAVTGPFRTKRAALWAEKYGRNNPHFRHVNDAERLSKVLA